MAKYNEHMDSLGDNQALLGTIKVPKNLSLLAERLPKAQYEQKEEIPSKSKKTSHSREISDPVRNENKWEMYNADRPLKIAE